MFYKIHDNQLIPDIVLVFLLGLVTYEPELPGNMQATLPASLGGGKLTNDGRRTT